MPPNQIHQGYWLLAAWWLLVGKCWLAGVAMVVALPFVVLVVSIVSVVLVVSIVSAAVRDVLPVMAIPRQMRASMMTPTTKEMTEDFTGECRRRPR